ncbi:hypothetical protein R0381_000776 [Jeongeupia wiesaeckerbachi]|uniref:DUF6841 family protein n=1 Tax=Jeongeupia wiesaeckerbachi TaxID=3051218 RepID=UPI003D804FD4
MSSTRLPAAIAQFFEQYRAAFNRLDGEAIAQLYAAPSGIVTDEGYTHWPDFNAVKSNMIALCTQYRDSGYLEARFAPSAFLAQGQHHAVVDVCWSIRRSTDLPPWQFNTTYNLRHTREGWRIQLCTAYEEKRLN